MASATLSCKGAQRFALASAGDCAEQSSGERRFHEGRTEDKGMTKILRCFWCKSEHLEYQRIQLVTEEESRKLPMHLLEVLLESNM